MSSSQSNNQTELSLSFEFFPAKTSAGSESFNQCVESLAPLSPAFVSVTYGAGGSTQERTLGAIADIRDRTGLATAGHLTCVGKSRAEVNEVIDAYEALGVEHIVALRGDPPEGSDDGRHADGFRDAADLVAGIRSRSDMTVSVAAYPEVHPRAASSNADMDNLKRKLDAGATQAITQFFFEADTFMRFNDRARSAGITAPIVAGIMPITSFSGIQNFAGRCGTRIPASLERLFDGLDEQPEIRQLVAATVAAELCQELIAHGINSFHFYTMNKPELTTAICRILGVQPHSPAPPVPVLA